MSCGSVPPMSTQIRPGARKVFCVKFQREMEGLDEIPFEGHPLGQKIYDSVSKEAWKMWLEHSKMLINEYRIDLMSEAGQRMWMTELEKYFFGEGGNVPAEFVPEKKA